MNDTQPHSSVQYKLTPAVSRELAEFNRYTPVTVSRGTLSLRQLAKRMSSGGGNLSTAQSAAFLERAFETILEATQEGHRITLGRLGYLGLRGSGVFTQEGTPVEGKELSFALRFQPGAEMKEEMSRITGELLETSKRAPTLRVLVDATSGTTNAAVTVGGMAKLDGQHLRFKPLMGDEGLFFIPQNGSADSTIKVTRFLDNRHTRLTFEVPALAEGETYRVEVRKRFNSCKTLRIGILDGTVQANG